MGRLFIKKDNTIIQEILMLIMEEFGRFLKLKVNAYIELEQQMKI